METVPGVSGCDIPGPPEKCGQGGFLYSICGGERRRIAGPGGCRPERAEKEAMSDRDTSVRGQSGAPMVVPDVQELHGKVDQLPPYRVLLHSDEKNDFVHVIETLVDLTPLTPQRATT